MFGDVAHVNDPHSWIKRKRPAHGSVNPWTPILFYSGAAYERDKQQAFAAGAQAYLVKPVDNDELIEEVSRVISDAKRTQGAMSA